MKLHKKDTSFLLNLKERHQQKKKEKEIRKQERYYLSSQIFATVPKSCVI